MAAIQSYITTYIWIPLCCKMFEWKLLIKNKEQCKVYICTIYNIVYGHF